MPSNVGATEHHQFYGTGSGVAAVAVDQSGNADCSVGESHIYQTAFTPGDPCTVMGAFDVDIGVEAAGYYFSRYSGTTRQGVRSDGNGGLQLLLSNAVVQTLSIPRGIGTYELVFSWAMVDNPLTTGASDASRSMVRVWRGDNGAFLDGIDWSHATPSLAGTDVIWGAQVTGGANSTGATLTGAGYLLHETSELNVLRDRVTAAAAPTITGDTAMEVPMPDWAGNFGAQGRVPGPTHLRSAAAISWNRLQTASPLVNYQQEFNSAFNYGSMSAGAMFTLSPDGSSYLALPWLWRRPVPRTVNRLKCRVFVRSNGDGPVENTVTVTAWSCNRNPGIESEESLDYRSTSDTFGPVNDNAPVSAGRWLDLGDLNIVRTGNQRYTWLALSVEVTGPSSAAQQNLIKAVVFEPWSETDTDADANEGSG